MRIGSPCASAADQCENTGGSADTAASARIRTTCRSSDPMLDQAPASTYAPCRTRVERPRATSLLRLERSDPVCDEFRTTRSSSSQGSTPPRSRTWCRPAARSAPDGPQTPWGGADRMSASGASRALRRSAAFSTMRVVDNAAQGLSALQEWPKADARAAQGRTSARARRGTAVRRAGGPCRGGGRRRSAPSRPTAGCRSTPSRRSPRRAGCPRAPRRTPSCASPSSCAPG